METENASTVEMNENTVVEQKVARWKSSCRRKTPLRLTYEDALTDEEDPDVANMFVPHEPSG